LQIAKTSATEPKTICISISNQTRIVSWLTEYNVAYGVKLVWATAQEHPMPYSSDLDNSQPAADRQPEPFASLTADDTRQGRSWLFNLLMGPFKDDDQRASYRLAGKVSDAQNRAGVRVAKAWNGNGAPVSNPPQSVGFSSADRQAAGR
jgi:hypothetical protein